MDIRLNDLKNFIETCSCITMGQAALKLEISQPALSESLKRLESDIGAILFFRSRSGIKLTATGRLFLERAKNVTSSLKNLNLRADSEQVFAGRSIVIGCHPTVASYSLPKALGYLKQKASDFKLELRHNLSRNIQASVQSGAIDVGLVINPVSVPDLVIKRLAYDHVSIWTANRSISLDTIICDSDLFQTQSILKKWKDRPQKLIATSQLDLIARLAFEDIGYGIIPDRAVQLSGLKLYKLKNSPSYKDEICLIYRPEFGKQEFEKITIEALKQGFIS
jgi:DNA-binding transcriptional LysR family regulator